MCTAFVRYGKDYICGFNMDINVGALNWRLLMDDQVFAVTLSMAERSAGIAPEGVTVPFEYTDCENNLLRLHGVNRNGNFGNQLNNMRFSKAPFEISDRCVPLYYLVDSFIRGRHTMQEIVNYAQTKKVVNLPAGPVDIPDLGMHSLLSDADGHIIVVEPGNGYAVLSDRYAVMSNFAVMELPGDFTPENFRFYGKDRYDTALSILRSSDDDFTVQDGLRLLDAVKQTGEWGTRISFVYSGNENAVYYALDHDFSNIRKHCFTHGYTDRILSDGE